MFEELTLFVWMVGDPDKGPFSDWCVTQDLAHLRLPAKIRKIPRLIALTTASVKVWLRFHRLRNSNASHFQ